MRREHEPYKLTTITAEPRFKLSRVFGVIVAFEAAYYTLGSIDRIVEFRTHFTLWPVAMLAAVVWPLVFWLAAYVLLKPRIPESVLEGLLRPVPVVLVILINIGLVITLLTHPEWVIRWPV